MKIFSMARVSIQLVSTLDGIAMNAADMNVMWYVAFVK